MDDDGCTCTDDKKCLHCFELDMLREKYGYDSLKTRFPKNFQKIKRQNYVNEKKEGTKDL